MIKNSGAYNNPEFAQATQGLLQAFAPPSASELAGYASARGTNQKTDQLAQLYAAGRTPSERAALTGTQGYGQTPQGFNYGVDTTAATSRSNNAADNTRALTQTGLNNRTDLVAKMFGAISPGDVRPALPTDIAKSFELPGLPLVQGSPKPMTQNEVLGGQTQRLIGDGKISDADLIAAVNGGIPVETVIGADGKPQFMRRSDAVGHAPAYNPNSGTKINLGPDGVDYGKPADGLAWARDPDGKVKLDDRGAPIAVPYQGGPAWKKQQDATDAASALDQSTALKNSVVSQNLDRALSAIEANPAFTTGLGSQATSWIGGSPARAVEGFLDPIRANIGFDQLQKMRDASPTGGALGQVSEKEIAFLQSVLGSINPEAGPQVIDDIKRLKNIYLDIIHGANQGPPREKLSFPSQWDAQTNETAPGGAAPAGQGQPEAPVYATNPGTGERVVLRNGKWEPAQ